MAVRATMAALITRTRQLIADTVPGAAGAIFAPLPPVPTSSPTGGTILAGTYAVVVTYTNAFGESLGSAAGSVVTTGSTSTMTIPSPSPSGNATGWYAYVSQANGQVLTRQQSTPTLIGIGLTLTAPPTSSGVNPPTVNTTGATLFLDQDVQDKLDECRRDLYQALLTPRITFTNTGFLYLDYYYIPGNAPNAKPKGFFEASEVLIRGDFSTIAPANYTADELVGHWNFSASQLPPVMLRGFRYDIYRAAADLLDYKIANLAATQIDFSQDGFAIHLSQQMVYLQKMRDDYRRKQEAVSQQTMRLDQSNTANGSPGIQPRQQYLVGQVSQNVPFLTGE